MKVISSRNGKKENWADSPSSPQKTARETRQDHRQALEDEALGLPKKRRSGRHVTPRRKLSAPHAAFELMDLAAKHADCEDWSDWARNVLIVSAADELGIDPLAALEQTRDHSQ